MCGLLQGAPGGGAAAEAAVERVYLQMWRIAPQFDPDEGSAVSLVLGVAHRELGGRASNHSSQAVVDGPVEQRRV